MEIVMISNERSPLPSKRVAEEGWYYVKGRVAVGPIPIAEPPEVRRALSEDASRSLLWRPGFVTWLNAAEVQAFASIVPFSPSARAHVATEGLM
jgi:hypothetical protein